MVLLMFRVQAQLVVYRHARVDNTRIMAVAALAQAGLPAILVLRNVLHARLALSALPDQLLVRPVPPIRSPVRVLPLALAVHPAKLQYP